MKLFIRIGALGIALAVSACGADLGEGYEDGTPGEVEHRIEGGTQVSSGRGAVNVEVSGGGGSCTGVIIGRRTLLTAAHCLANAGFGHVNVQVKVHYRDDGTWWCLSEPAITNTRCTRFAEGTAWVNPAYETSSSGTAGANKDIAVVSLNNEFSYIRVAHRHQIIEQPTVAAIGNFNTIGYGALSDANGNGSRLPYEAEFQLGRVSGSHYFSWGGRIVGEDDDTGMRLCAGDSGAPQFEWSGSSRYLFGLHSHRQPRNGACAELDVRQYGVQVGPYVPDIEAHLGFSCRHWTHASYGPMADCWP